MRDLSFISNADPAYIDSLYYKYLEQPDQLEPGWQQFFKGFLFAQSQDSQDTLPEHGELNQTALHKELAVMDLIQSYRSRAHLISDTNPIRTRQDRKPKLALSDFRLEDADLNKTFQAGQLINLPGASLKSILSKLQDIYCRSIGFEINHIESQEKRQWLLQKIESHSAQNSYGLKTEDKKRILRKINGAVIFEKFLHTKYVGQKRFSLEGGECLIPALDFILEASSSYGAEEVIIGMAHRGRLNVLANIIGKTYSQIFSEFEGKTIPDLSFGSGDVKYHLGFSSQIQTSSSKKLQLKLAPNPSHLESVNPVVTGLARAKADLLYESEYDKIVPVLIHGDAAVAGQGIVYETVQMSQLKGYYTGGTIHFVINNQIGFTTDFADTRSSTYCTASAYLVKAPVIHVNGDDPEAVVFAALLAIEYRQQFNEDVFIDMVCYRRHGHNEGDDPKFTQPTLYELIKNHPNVREIYSKSLTEQGHIEAELAQALEKEFWEILQERLNETKEKPLDYVYQEPELSWKSLKRFQDETDFYTNPDTSVSKELLHDLVDKLVGVPANFKLLPKVKKLFASWEEMKKNEIADWATAELLAYSTLLVEGKNVRLSGQDVKRGTFSHRHAVVFDEKNATEHNRLSGLRSSQGKFFIYNSLLSEFGVLGFEYGYSLASPDQLIIWEAQFGDFTNGAQVILDQYISSAQRKWNRMSGLVLYLPHGYDGQGPEHSSARLERFLQSCAELNMVVVNVTTPSNFFHLLRRQLHWNFRKPLIVMSPKSLLRNPECISKFSDFSEIKSFSEVLESNLSLNNKLNKIIFCSGQIYFQLIDQIKALKKTDTEIIRLEQLYPFPANQLEGIIKKHTHADMIWVQEEPLNMGAASFIKLNWKWGDIKLIGRPASAAPAAGHKKSHDLQIQNLMDLVFN